MPDTGTGTWDQGFPSAKLSLVTPGGGTEAWDQGFPSGGFAPYVPAEVLADIDVTAAAATVSLIGYSGDVITATISVTAPSSEVDLLGGAPTQATIGVTARAATAILFAGPPYEAIIAVEAPNATALLYGGVGISGIIDVTAPAATVLLTSGELTAIIEVTAPAASVAMIAYVDVGLTAVIDVTAPEADVRIEASFPVFRLTLTIDGVNMNDYWSYSEPWNISKDGSLEDARFTIIDPIDSEDALRIPRGAIVLLEHPYGGLIYGGRVKKVTDSRIGDGVGTKNVLDCEDWMFVAKRPMIDPQTFAPGYFYERIEEIRVKYLDSYGIQTLMPIEGGDLIAELIVDEPISIHELFDRYEELIGWPWRINGLQKFAFVEPGSLIWPEAGGELNGTNAKLVPDVVWEEEDSIAYNFLYMKLASHPAGDGPYHHNENRVATGERTVFPVNVLPTEVEGQLAADAAPLATTLLLKELPPGAIVRNSDEFYIDGDPRKYYIVTGGTVDTDGNVTVTFFDPLELEAKEGATVKFLPGAMINLIVNGTMTEFAGSPWVWDKTTASFVNPAYAPPAGTTIRYEAYVKAGGWVRAWETSDPPVQLPIGWFDYSIMSARKEDNEDHWEWVETVQYLRDKITESLELKRRVTLTTHEHGIYPFIQVNLNFPSRLITGAYLCEKVEITSNYADPTLTQNDLQYTCTFRKDFTGPKNFDFWKPVSQIRWGPGELPEIVDFQWTTNREYIYPGAEDGIVLNPIGEWIWTDWVEVTPYAFAALVFTGIVIQENDSRQPFFARSRRFEVQLGVGESGDETVIANFKGHSVDHGYGVHDSGIMRLMIPVDACPQGSKVWIRMRYAGDPEWIIYGPGPWHIAVQAYAKPLTGNLITTPYAQETTNVGEEFTSVTLSAVLNTWSDWYTILDETPYDLFLTGRVFSVVTGHDIHEGQVQWAMHEPEDAPTEDDVIFDEAFTNAQVAVGNNNWYGWHNPYFMNSGLRISVRMRNTYQESGVVRCALTYVRFS
jgi:hypothetical protein